MITGHHDSGNTRLARLGNGFPHPGTKRVDHANQADAGEIRWRGRRVRLAEAGRRASLSYGEYSVTGIGHLAGHGL